MEEIMGQQQILLIVLSVILVGIAIAVGITMFRAQAKNSNLDGIISDLNNLGNMAYQYKIRPTGMGGGGGSYVGFDTESTGYYANLPEEMQETDNVTQPYEVLVVGTDEDATVQIRGWHTTYEHGRQVTVDPNGVMTIQDYYPGSTGG